MRISIFSIRRRHELSSPSAPQMGAIPTLDSAKDSANAEFQSKEELTSIGEDEPTIILLKDGHFKLKADQRVANEGACLLSDRRIKQQTEEENDYKNVGTDDTSTVIRMNMLPPMTAIDASACKGYMHADMPISTEIVVDASIKGTCSHHPEEPPHSPPKLNPEFAGFSSVQDWVNSLEQEGFSHCPTPVMSTSFGIDNMLMQKPLDRHIDEQHGNEIMAVLPVPGSPLHEHFGYKSARELLRKTLSSDDEIKAHSDTNSSPSTSNTSANTFKPPGFDNVVKSAARSTSKQVAKSHGKKNTHIEQEDQTSLANLLKKSFKGFGERRSIIMSNSKSRVVVNGHALSEAAIKRAEERAGKLRPGTYWYDSMAGFWGIVGGPCLGVLPPFIEELHYPMAGDCSNGDTQVYVNGRELHHKDLALLSHRGLSKKPGRAYAIGFDGVVIEEASGQELKHLGKLAPTVEKRGKGFGMYMEKMR